jgi:hypothetical protein
MLALNASTDFLAASMSSLAADFPSGIEPGALGLSHAKVGTANSALRIEIATHVFFMSLSTD